MVDGAPSTSKQSDVDFDEEFMTKTRRKSLQELNKDLEMLENDTHPLLSTVIRKRNHEQLVQEDRIRCHRERAEQKANEDFDAKKTEIDQEYQMRISELLDEARKRSEELDRVVIHDYGVVDINKPMTMPLIYESNKKTLRGRGGGQLIEPASYFNSNQANRGIPEFNLRLAFDDSRIRQDLDLIMNRAESRRKNAYSVSIQKPKLVIDNKAFKHGEDVIVFNSTYGEFLAKIDIVDNNFIHFKGCPAWDSRVISATLEDIEDGRVTILKHRGKEKASA